MASFTEFYCDAATGANINAGDNKTVTTSTNGDWGNAAANRFTAASGTPFSGVSVGDFASVYLDGATVAVYIARVTAVNAGGASLDLSATAKSGTAPSNGATGRSCTVGGKWLGPNGASAFPIGFITNALKNASGDAPRVNFKAGTTYSITAAMSQTNSGPIVYQGYTSSVGDGGRATIDGGTSGVSYTLLTATSYGYYCDLIFQNNGASGSSDLVNAGTNAQFERCVFNSGRGSGIFCGNPTYVLSCEAYSCNQSNTANKAGFVINGDSTASQCIAHDNTGSNTDGFYVQTMGILHNCIADTNGSNGFRCATNNQALFEGCVSYNNTGAGVLFSATGFVTLSNCIFVSNGTYGANQSGATGNFIRAINCAYYNNTSGATNGAFNSSGAITLTGDPFTAASTGNFTLNNTASAGAACRGAGSATFTETQASYTGTVSYPDVGAAQHQDAGGSAGMLFIPNLEGV